MRQAEVDSLDYFKQSVSQLAEFHMMFRHFKLQGTCIVASSLSKHLFHIHSKHENKNEMVVDMQLQNLQSSGTDSNQDSVCLKEDLFEKLYLSLTSALQKRSQFNELFAIGSIYDSDQKQAEGYYDSSIDHTGFNSLQIHHIFMSILQRDVLDSKTHEQMVT